MLASLATQTVADLLLLVKTLEPTAVVVTTPLTTMPLTTTLLSLPRSLSLTVIGALAPVITGKSLIQLAAARDLPIRQFALLLL